MSKRQVWVIEVADRGKANWSPLSGDDCLSSKKDAVIRLSEYSNPPRERWVYRMARYVPEDK